MGITQIIWLIICGIVIIAGFSLGSFYLNEWKEACIAYAKYSAKSKVNIEKKTNDKWVDTYESEIAENLVKKQICMPVWVVSFICVLVFLGIVGWVLLK